MYRILHIPSGTYVYCGSGPTFEIYETRNKQKAQREINRYVLHWDRSIIYLEEEIEIVRTKACWFDILSTIKYTRAEFEIIKV